MGFFRKHWYDIGGMLAVLIGLLLVLFHTHLTSYRVLMWLSLISLFLHQLEEYRVVGTFPGMLNKVMYQSAVPDRYPLNTQTAFVVNVCIGWTVYGLAAIAGEKAIWLGIATMSVSLGNFIAHVWVFNIKGGTRYNAGMATSCTLFAPCVFFFVKLVFEENLADTVDVLVGVFLGLIINYLGVLKAIGWLANRNTTHVFDKRNLLPGDRQ